MRRQCNFSVRVTESVTRPGKKLNKKKMIKNPPEWQRERQNFNLMVMCMRSTFSEEKVVTFNFVVDMVHPWLTLRTSTCKSVKTAA